MKVQRMTTADSVLQKLNTSGVNTSRFGRTAAQRALPQSADRKN